MAKKSRTQDTAADFARRSNAVSRMNRPRLLQPQRPTLVGKDFSPRPMPNPRRSVEAPGSGLDQGPAREEMERGTSAPSRSIRPMMREAKKFAEGGEVRGCKAGQMSGKGFSGNY